MLKMDTKVCNKCLVEKDVSSFYKAKNTKSGYYSICKECKLDSNRKWSEKNEEKVKIISKNWRENNKEKIKENEKKWRESNKEKVYLVKKEYRKNNKEKITETAKKYRQTEKYKKYRKKYRKENKEKILDQQRKRPDYFSEYKKIKYKNDIIYRITVLCRARVGEIMKIKNINKRNTTFEIIGCTPEFLKEYLEKQFVDGMNWENRGEWHIDHIIPLASAKTEEEVYKLCHYTNLQPLWAEENLRKGNKITPTDNTEQTDNNPTE